MKWLLYSLVFCSSLVLYGCRRELPASARDILRSQAVADLKLFLPSDATPLAETNEMEMRFGTWASYGVPGNTGKALLSFGENQWLYLRSHSEHLPDEVGDLCVAVDQGGTLYQLSAHVCGGIRFADTNSDEFAQSTKDFMSRFVPWPDASKTWHKMEASPTNGSMVASQARHHDP